MAHPRPKISLVPPGMSIKAMIENIAQIPKINGKLLPPIITSTRLKQRDNLSPILFDNLFDDVDQIFDSQCNPVIFNSEISLNQLPYADDMAILSLSYPVSYPVSEVPELKQLAVRMQDERANRAKWAFFALWSLQDL